jgi:predicted AAA+ superfamily ATPase
MQSEKKSNDVVKRGFCASLMVTCRDASRLQSEALDKKLSFAQRFGLALHLAICKWCRRYGKQVRFLREAAHEHPENLSEAVPQKLSVEARERIKQRLQAGQ